MIITVEMLPPPPIGKTGFPWTEGSTPPQYKSQKLPSISIVTPSFNQGKFIEETIRSVLLQNYAGLEYIVIDGNSTDETIEILRKYSQFLNYWISEPDDGQADAILKGLEQATGEVFNWLNSDDVYLPNALQKVGQYFAENPMLDVLCAREHQRIETTGVQTTTNGTTISSKLEETVAHAFVNQPPTFFRTTVFREAGLEKKFHFLMDADVWVSYLLQRGQQNVLKTTNILDIFRVHGKAKSSTMLTTYYRERLAILLSISRSLSATQRIPEDFLKDHPFLTTLFSKTYIIQTEINERLLAAYLAERVLYYFVEFISWQSLFVLYFFSLRRQMFGRTYKFYIAPLVKIKRLFQPLPM